MKERIVNFGPGGCLLGIVTVPTTPPKDKPAFILINSGLLHRIGPFRLYVELARSLASEGFTVLRMDLSGKGESQARRDGKSHQQNVLDDISDAIEHLQRRCNASRVVVAGICTGADNAYQSALHDERVVGIVPIDGYAYRTSGFYLRHYGPKLLVLSHWTGFLKRMFSSLKNRISPSFSGGKRPTVNYRMMFPPRSRFRKDLRTMLNRSVHMLIVYSGGWSIFYNYEKQFSDAFPNLSQHDCLRLEFNAKADHTYILAQDRERLITRICTWATENF